MVRRWLLTALCLGGLQALAGALAKESKAFQGLHHEARRQNYWDIDDGVVRMPGTARETRDKKCRMWPAEQFALEERIPRKLVLQTLREHRWYYSFKDNQKKKVVELRKSKLGRLLLRKPKRFTVKEEDFQHDKVGLPDKMIYFLVHEDAECTLDGPLKHEGVIKAQDLIVESEEAKKALGRAEVIFTSPSVKDMQTAILMYDALPNISKNIVIDPDLLEVGDFLIYSEGEKVLQKYSRQDLLDSYTRLWPNSTDFTIPQSQFWIGYEDPPNRWNHFLQMLYKRPERFITVLGSQKMFDAGLDENLKEGEYTLREYRYGKLFKIVKDTSKKRRA